MHIELYTAYDKEGDELYKIAQLIFRLFGFYFSIKFESNGKRKGNLESFRVERFDREIK